MKIKLGSNIADARGKLNGHVFSKNRYGNYVRNKVTPVNPNTTYQTAVRNRLSGISSSWGGLTQAQRNAWNSAVSSFSKTNIFGDIINPSGKTLHSMLNNELSITGTAVINTPPVPTSVDAFTSMSIAIAAGAATAAMTYAPVIAADHKVKVYATPGMSAGVSFVKAEYRLIAVIAAADVSPFSFKTAFEARFGALPAAGLKVFVRVVQVNTVTGQAGIGLTASAIVAA